MRSELESIPGVGPSIARDLRALGVHRVSDLRRRNPGRMYQTLCDRRGHQDRCLLYVFRCAVYYAKTLKPRPRLLKWWNWKDGKGLPIAD